MSTNGAVPSSAAPCAELLRLQKDRKFAIKSQSRIDRVTESYIAGCIGYHPGMAERARANIWQQVSAIRKNIEKGGWGQEHPEIQADTGLSADALASLVTIVLESADGRTRWDNLRKAAERNMKKIVKTLPVYKWANKVRGFGDLGLGIVVGETTTRDGETIRTLSDYATKERVWKRLGLAVIDGIRQQRRRGVEEAIAHGFNPWRRAEIWTIGDAMLRYQWRAAREGSPAGPAGPYGEVYYRRKMATEGRDGWTPARRDADARRIMTKALIEDLWRIWNGLESKYVEAAATEAMTTDIDLPPSSAATSQHP